MNPALCVCMCCRPALPHLATTGLLLRINSVTHYLLRLLRRLAMTAMLALPSMRQWQAANLAEDDITYEGSSLARPAGAAGAGAAGANSSGGGGGGGCAGRGFPDVSISIRGVMRPATDLLRGAPGDGGSCGTLVIMLPARNDSKSSTSSSSSSTAAGATRGSKGEVGDAASWPAHWNRWPLNVVKVLPQGGGGSSSSAGGDNGAAAAAAHADEWGLLAAALGGSYEGVLVRPDGMIAAAGSPGDIRAWLDAHVAVSSDAMGVAAEPLSAALPAVQ